MKTCITVIFLSVVALGAIAQEEKIVIPEKDVVYVLDDVISDYTEIEKIDLKKIASIEVLNGKSAIEKYGDAARNGVVVIRLRETKRVEKKLLLEQDEKVIWEPLYIKDGKAILKRDLATIDADNIHSIEVLKGEMAIDRYGDNGKNGVVVIRTKGRVTE